MPPTPVHSPFDSKETEKREASYGDIDSTTDVSRAEVGSTVTDTAHVQLYRDSTHTLKINQWIEGSEVDIKFNLYRTELTAGEVPPAGDIPEVGTTALLNGEHSADALASLDSDTVDLVDVVSYRGLVPGREYTISGVIMDAKTGKPLPAETESGNTSVTDLKFTPTEEEGQESGGNRGTVGNRTP